MTDLASPPSTVIEIEVPEHGHAAPEPSGSRAVRAVALPIGLLGTTVVAIWIGAELCDLVVWAMDGLLGFLEQLRRFMWLLGR